MITPTAPLTLRAPGSTSNLGPGFDVLGLAVDRHLTVTWEPGGAPLETILTGTLEGLSPDGELVGRTLAAALGVARDTLGGRLRLDSAIPVARGLGSSATARAAGRALALAFRHLAAGGGNPDGPLRVTEGERAALALEVSQAEGHPDNAVPTLVGGFVAASLEGDTLRWTPLPLSPGVGMAFAAPAVEVRTDDARRVLPATVGHAEAVGNGARLVTLLAGLARADGDRIAWGLEDRLHVPYRMPLVPRGHEAVGAAREAGAWGVTLSGSGSGLLAFSPPSVTADVAAAMDAVFAGVPGPGQRCAFPLHREIVGLTVTD